MILDNFEEYDDPKTYDSENESYKEDLPFLLKWAAVCVPERNGTNFIC